MQRCLFIIGLILLAITFNACKKRNKIGTDCANASTVRQIINKQATIKLTGATNPVYIVEDGAIDTKLIPCNFRMEFYENDLRVIISGDVKLTMGNGFQPCCTENFVITKISR